MEFRRINGLPPYVFATIDALKLEARRAGKDVIDLGFGNPDLPSPDVAVEKLAEAAHNPRNHRYSSSKGIPKLRQAVADLYLRKFGVELDPDTEVVTTIGAKEGLSPPDVGAARPGRHGAGALALVPDPHLRAAVRRGRRPPGPPRGAAGAADAEVGAGAPSPGDAFFDSLMETWESTWPKPRVIVLSFPHNPTTACVDLAFMERLVALRPRARRRPGARLRLRRHRLRRLRAAVDPPGARGQGRGRRALHPDQVVLDGRVAGGLHGGQRRDRPGPHQAEELPRLRDLPAHPDRRHRGHERGARLPQGGQRELPGAGATPCATGSTASAGTWRRPRGRCSSGPPSPSPTGRWARSSSPSSWCARPRWPPRRGSASGPGGDGHVRFALIENEQRIGQAVRNLRTGPHQAWPDRRPARAPAGLRAGRPRGPSTRACSMRPARFPGHFGLQARPGAVRQ